MRSVLQVAISDALEWVGLSLLQPTEHFGFLQLSYSTLFLFSFFFFMFVILFLQIKIVFI